MTDLDALTEKVIQYFTSSKYADEVVDAKREFFENSGILNDESSDYDLRMCQFLDWYLFTRELSVEKLPPMKALLHLESNHEWSEEEISLLDQMGQAKHSLFEFVKVKGNDIYVKDLFAGKKVVLKDSSVVLGFDRDEVFEARLIPLKDNFVFTRGFCFHPAGAKKFILKEVKKVKKLTPEDQGALALRLLKMRYKHEQYGHIRLDYIYTNDSKLKF